jgi:sigma-B regulation protein RsbU (phosphoserine phosphatase)
MKAILAGKSRRINLPGDLNILLVEDSSSEQKYIKQVIYSLDHTVATCASGEEAWELFNRNNFQLLLLDWVLPGMDGLELCRRLRATPAGEKVSIVVITARSEPEDLEKVLEAGADDYISKMAGPDLFRVRLRIALQQAYMRRERVKVEGTLAGLNSRLIRDQHAAAQVQQSMLPKALPVCRDISFDYLFMPCEEMGGDMLNIFRLDENTIGFYLADIAGHGIEAALFAAMINSILQPSTYHSSLSRWFLEESRTYRIVPPVTVAEKLNKEFPFGVSDQLIFTLLYAILDCKSLTLKYAVAGHQGIILQSIAQGARVIKMPSFPIGASPTPGYEEQIIQFQPGDRFFVFSDGVSETSNSKNEQFGDNRIKETLERTSGLNIKNSVKEILTEVFTFRGNVDQEDDVTILSIEVLP